MEAREFYNKRIKEEPTIGSVQLMEEYAKHIIEINFCELLPKRAVKMDGHDDDCKCNPCRLLGSIFGNCV